MMDASNDYDIDDSDRKPAASVLPKLDNSLLRTRNIYSIGESDQGLNSIQNACLQTCSQRPESNQTSQQQLVSENDEGFREEDTFIVPRKILDEYSDEKKNLHRIALFRLFSGNYSTSRLSEIAQKCGLKEPQNSEFKIEDMVLNYRKCSNDARVSIDIDPSLPHQIGNLAMKSRYSCYTIGESLFGHQQSLQSLGIRSGYTSMSLSDLEKSIREWYHKTMLSRDNTTANKTPTFFTLRFNESSLSMLSKWACKNNGKKSSGSIVDEKIVNVETNVKKTSTPQTPVNQTFNDATRSHVTTIARQRQPTVDARFRKCSICHYWGHYEIECSKMPYETVLRFGKELDAIMSKPGQFPGVPNVNEQELLLDDSKFKLLHPVSTQGPLNADATEANIVEGSKTDACVTIEMFNGFLFEQRSEPETFRQASKPKEEKILRSSVKYDDSFIVDGFKIKAATSVSFLLNGRPTDVAPESKEKKKKRKRLDKEHRKYELIKTQRKPGSGSLFSFCEGDIVAWFPTPDEENHQVFTGIVATVPEFSDTKTEQSKMILVEFFASIPASPRVKSEYIDLGADSTLPDHISKIGTPKSLPSPPIGAGIWISSEDLHLVQEHADVAYPDCLRRNKRKQSRSSEVAGTCSKEYTKSKKRGISFLGEQKSKARGMSYSQRFKETGRVYSSDMSLAPRKPAKQLADGSFSMPQGRRPVGLEWDPVRGVWALPLLRKKKKKKVSSG